MITFRDILKQDLESRQKVHSAFSLRAYAKYLGIAAGQLSEILSGKKGLSFARAKAIVPKLNINSTDKIRFLESVAASCHRDPVKREVAKERLAQEQSDAQAAHQLSQDQYEMVASWIHFAILALSGTPRFKLDERWIASHLNASLQEVSIATERLKRLGLFEGSGLQYAPRKVPSSAVRFHHRQIFLKAIASLDRDPMSDRNFEETTCAFRSEDLPEIQRLQAEFMKSIFETFGTRTHRNRVYSIGTFMFPLSRDTVDSQVLVNDADRDVGVGT